MGKGLCHCLEIFDKLGSSAMAGWGKNAQPSNTCVVPEMGWKERAKWKNLKEKAQWKRKIVVREIFNVSCIYPKEHWCET